MAQGVLLLLCPAAVSTVILFWHSRCLGSLCVILVTAFPMNAAPPALHQQPPALHQHHPALTQPQVEPGHVLINPGKLTKVVILHEGTAKASGAHDFVYVSRRSEKKQRTLLPDFSKYLPLNTCP